MPFFQWAGVGMEIKKAGANRSVPPDVTSVLGQVVVDSTCRLFSAYGLAVKEVPVCIESCPEEAQSVTSIGFAGELISGSVVMILPERLLAATGSVAGCPVAADWGAELINQLAGRVKNQLLDYGVVINVALPLVVRGNQLTWNVPSGALSELYCFATPVGGFALRLDAMVSPALALTPSRRTDAHMPEGEICIF
jgi:hypothetical protein